MEGTARDWLQRLHALPRRARFRIMNVCGGHERVITHAGLRGALPDYIELIPGPGCPVCICPEEDIYAAMHMALHHPVILLCFGDLLRVPVNAPRDTPRSLLEARAAGADVRAIASPLEARAIARRHPDKPVIFFAAGFETTMAPVAAMIAEDMPDNLLLLIAGRLTWPAVAMLLASGAPGFDALIAPGHVATVMGSEEWRFVSAQYDLPTAVAGFGAESLLAAVYAALQQDIADTPRLDNCYPALVTAAGNAAAQRLLREVFEIVDGNWRGIGVIPQSAFALRGRYRRLDAHTHFAIDEVTRRRPPLRQGLHAGKTGGAVHGLRRRGLSHLVARRHAFAREDIAGMSAAHGTQQRARLLHLRGRVQGVGFRPYVFRLARRFDLTGWVVNRRGTVSVHVQGAARALDAFQQALLGEAPAPAQPLLHDICDAPLMDLLDFRIHASETQDDADIHVPPDLAPCADCLAELRDSTNRRHGYPFINCARCGPRYTLIRDLPYDRANTTMAAFDLCATCAREYHSPADRRFHAEPIACAICGPRLSFEQDGLRTDDHRDALAACVALLRAGGIGAVKGIGGYHLMCDAHDAEAIARLRARKHRPHKPFAVMFADPGAATREALARDVHVDDAQFALLRSDARPVVLLPRTPSCTLPDIIAPGLRVIGVLLPYSPLHHLLLDAFGAPLVATSGNVSGEPVISDNAEARERHGANGDGVEHNAPPHARPP